MIFCRLDKEFNNMVSKPKLKINILALSWLIGSRVLQLKTYLKTVQMTSMYSSVTY